MDIKKLLKKVLTLSCIYFTAIMVVYMAILQFTHTGSDPAAAEAGRVLLFFFAAMLFAIAALIRRSDKIHSVLKVFVHYVICTLTLLICILLPANLPQASHYITGIVLFTVIYFLVRIIIWAFSARLKKNQEKIETYTKQFQKVNKK